ncbi:unnamed protein product [Miscanthus lutarioriparius]|uniref:Uncharacterized protein n=1 Tax=Miscanthus lutarioriparius TaxID=422564 RepID=A0A811Q5Y3_9POAL|nr:unnamed protein product [Miscanthus lutarioriparius]
MEATVVSVGKAVLDGVLGCAQSTVVEEMRQQLGIERDVGFITDELEMMQSFLTAADEEQDPKKVPTTLVKQVRDLAYNVEDSLMDFKVYSEVQKSSWCCFARNLHDRHRIAMELKELRDKVEEVSRRNHWYHIISDDSKHGAEQGRMWGIDKAWHETVEDVKSPVDLAQLINSVEMELRVIAVWGSSGELGKTTEVRKAYDDPKVKAKFEFRAWVRLMRPFNPYEFIESLVRQFYVNSYQKTSKAQEGTTVGANILLTMENITQSDLVHVLNELVNTKSYLIVINDLSTIEEWDFIRTYFPDKKMRSRIVVNTQEFEVACLCTEQPYQMSELKQLSPDQTLYLIHKKIQMWYSVMPTTLTIEKKLGRSLSKTRSVTPEDIVVGRSTEKQKLNHLLGQPDDDSQGCKVISVWGMGGIGKTTLVRSVYQSQQLGGWKRAWATASRFFNSDALLWNLALQLQTNIEEQDSTRADSVKLKKDIREMGHQEMTSELSRLLGTQNCLIVLDDLSTTEEWDSIKSILLKSKRVIVTTREKSVAEHCSEDEHNIYNLVGIEDDAALDLLKTKVFSDATSFELHPRMLDQAKLILKKCKGLPLGISTIGGYLKFKPKTAMEWRKLHDSLDKELQTNPADPNELISTVITRSYDGLPYPLKAGFLYMSIFPEQHIIQRKRLVRRWIAEDYARETEHMKAEQVGYKHFDELVDRSMILPMEGGRGRSGKIDYCQLHDLIREICVSKARAENLVLTLEEGCNLRNTRSRPQGAIRHLAISSSWKRDKDVIQTTLDLSHVRSLTVFGEWRSFLISNKMRFLRVLDLEHTTGLRDHHLDKIGELIHVRLPDSVGNLRQLQTLDVRGTRVQTLPTCVTKLQKLEYLYASGFLRRRQEEYKPRDGALDGHAIAMGGIEDASKLRGVQVPRGISKLKALHTLRVVNVTQGKATTFQELRELTQLRKLGVTGVGKKNSEKFWLAIGTGRHYGLRSLSVYNPSVDDELDGCLGGDLLPPKRLESLKMHGKLVKAAGWIHRLQNLSKLQLEKAELNQDALEAIGMLPNLAVLRLRDNSFVGKLLRFQGSSFPSILVLELDLLIESVRFEHEAMPKLEVIQAYRCKQVKEFSGLPFLTSLVEIRLDGDVYRRVQGQLAELRNGVVLRLL